MLPLKQLLYGFFAQGLPFGVMFAPVPFVFLLGPGIMNDIVCKPNLPPSEKMLNFSCLVCGPARLMVYASLTSPPSLPNRLQPYVIAAHLITFYGSGLIARLQ